MNAICERVNGALRRELLDRILILGERHLALVLGEYVAHYNGHRPHQSRQQRSPDMEEQPVRDVADLRSIRRKRVVAGVVSADQLSSSCVGVFRFVGSAEAVEASTGVSARWRSTDGSTQWRQRATR